MGKLRIEVHSTIRQQTFQGLCQQIRQLLRYPLDDIEQGNLYLIENEYLNNSELQEVVREFAGELFYDPLIQRIFMAYNEDFFHNIPAFVLEVTYRPGVTDNSGKVAEEVMKIINFPSMVASGKLYYLYGKLTREQAEHLGKEYFGNELIQSISVYDFASYHHRDRFNLINLPKVCLSTGPVPVKNISLNLSPAQLIALSEQRCLALTLNEMEYLQSYFNQPQLHEERAKQGLGNDPTDVELEIIAQTWSEHCKHKIFNAEIDYQETEDETLSGKKLGNLQISSLFKSFIKKSTYQIIEQRQLPWAISVFHDNAGIVRFDGQLDYHVKVETHNSPSALDPYGGALTGILGVNRDIMGCGMGARPVANLDVFCFGPPQAPQLSDAKNLPLGLKHPRRILSGVHKGIEDGGNKSGIPTVNGAIYFDWSFTGKPLVFCGTIGVAPHLTTSGQEMAKKDLRVGDRIVMVGGAIGADGIHGATFSSLDLNENSPATAVQIGDPLTQKRVLDFLQAALAQELYSGITDNGAGGLSSSVGEMSTFTGGARMDLAHCEVKYPGLTPYELMVSESQERMTLAVRPEKLPGLLALAQQYGVMATDIGEFTDSGKLEVFYQRQLVASLNLNFLHDSLPPMQLTARWTGPHTWTDWITPSTKKVLTVEKFPWEEVTLKLLATPNIASKESWVRQYDAEVQAATIIKPFNGKTQSGPSDSGVIWAYPHGGEEENAMAVGVGLRPRLSRLDPYLMALYAVDEALSNVVAVGADIDRCCLLDNFCWPDPVFSEKNPDGAYKLAQLVRACVGLYDITTTYGTPLVSGKDSMKNDYRGKMPSGRPVAISILPTLLVTAVAHTQLNKIQTADFKTPGDLIYLLTPDLATASSLQFSELAETYNLPATLLSVPPLVPDLPAALTLYRQIYSFSGHFASCHDVSDGGLMVALCECLFGNLLGAEIVLGDKDQQLAIHQLWHEGPSRFVISIAPEKKVAFERHFLPHQRQFLGVVSKIPTLLIKDNLQVILQVETKKLLASFQTEF